MSNGKLQEKYELSDQVLGQGSFAVVKMCRLKETGELRACKIISKYIVSDVRAVDPQYLNAEVEILQRVGSHPNILQAQRSCELHAQSVIMHSAPSRSFFESNV